MKHTPDRRVLGIPGEPDKSTEPAFSEAQKGEKLVGSIARALYETDEDIVDDNISDHTAMGDWSWSDGRFPRLAWDELDEGTRRAYHRRARSAIAAMDLWSGKQQRL